MNSSSQTTHQICNIIARVVSIIGHPLIFLSTAALIAATEKGVSMQQLKFIFITLVMLGLISMAYSYFQVRSGRWTHIDASAQGERKTLNIFLATLCLLSAGIVWVLSDRPHMAIALALSGALFIIALLISKWVKLSLHTAFAVFATTLLWPNIFAVSIGIIMTALLIWSRLTLGRHVVKDIIVGFVTGACAGVLYQLLST